MKEKELEKILKALANHRRLLILKILKNKKRESVGAIAKEIKLSFKATSRHLTVLYSKNLLEREQVSLQIFYSLNPDLPKAAQQIISLL